MRMVVIGSKGMLGTDLATACKAADNKTIGYDIDEFDITDFKNVRDNLPPADWVINCAAYTRVDEAQSRRDLAYAVNSEGARNLAHACSKKRVKLVHVSTDYVFDGSRGRPYAEADQTNPVNIYGASKLAGEKAVRGEGGHYLIVRTQSLFGKNGPNFVRTIRKKLVHEAGPIRVVVDQVTSPTYTKHLADAILRLINRNAKGIVHVAASRACSWFAFAQAIAKALGSDTTIEPTTTEALALPAVRPPYSVLDSRKYRTLTGHVMPTWEQGLAEYLAEGDS